MKRLALLLGGVTLAVLLTLPATASGTTYSFNLTGPNTAEDPSSHRTIRVTGSGNFDTPTGPVTASGSFTRFNSNGSVADRGTWQATAFVSFLPFGGPRPGFQGGKLQIRVTLFPEGGSPQTGVSMSVTCRVNAPASFTEEEGTTVGSFTEKTGGLTLFHLD
jgi:hypothetical protein